MSQHHLKDKQGRTWKVGFDNPRGGFFAMRYAPEGAKEECDVLIGFGKGVTIEVLDQECRKHGLELDEKFLVQLFHDETLETRELSPLQQNIHSMFAEIGFFDNE